MNAPKKTIPEQVAEAKLKALPPKPQDPALLRARQLELQKRQKK